MATVLRLGNGMATVAICQVHQTVQNCLLLRRCLSTELTAALRPFYFAVHPDLFGQHPEQRKTNENSLKLLSAHLEALHQSRYSSDEAKVLQFYVRESKKSERRDNFRLIQIRMDKGSRDPKRFIQHLLESCNLSTDYIKAARPTTTQKPQQESMANRPSYDYNYNSEFADFEAQFRNVSNPV